MAGVDWRVSDDEPLGLVSRDDDDDVIASRDVTARRRRRLWCVVTEWRGSLLILVIYSSPDEAGWSNESSLRCSWKDRLLSIASSSSFTVLQPFLFHDNTCLSELLWPAAGLGFYPRDAMQARVIEIATCPSVRHAPVLCQNEER